VSFGADSHVLGQWEMQICRCRNNFGGGASSKGTWSLARLYAPKGLGMLIGAVDSLASSPLKGPEASE
jgi:hypothetical protein